MARRADPERILSHLRCRREGAGYRVVHGDSETAFVITRDENEPSHSPNAWTLMRAPKCPRTGAVPWADVRHMDAAAGKRAALLAELAAHIANVSPIAFL